MSNKWKRIGQDAWVEMPRPDSDDYISEYGRFIKVEEWRQREHHPIANLESGWWKEGEVKELDKDFSFRGGEQVYEGVSSFSGKLYSNIPIMAIPKISTTEVKPQPTTERKFTLDEMKTALMDGINFESKEAYKSRQFIHPANFIEQYFKEKFNIDL